MGHCLDLQEEPQNLEQILSDCKETLKYCVKTGKTPVESFFVTDQFICWQFITIKFNDQRVSIFQNLFKVTHLLLMR